MRRLGIVWVLFGATVLVVSGAMAWLTVKAWEVDRGEHLARRQRDREADAGRVLWRMDAFVTPLLADEAARPHWAYDPVLVVADGPKPRRVLSPLAAAPEFVRLHFTLHPDGRLTSPQLPAGADREWAVSQGLRETDLEASQKSLQELARSLTQESLLARLPAESLPAAGLDGDLVSLQNMGNSNTLNSNTLNQGNSVLVMPQSEVSLSQRPDQGDFRNREQAAQNYASRRSMQVQQTTQDGARPPTISAALEGPSLPLWVGQNLIVARRTRFKGKTLVQGCWLDWDALRKRLTSEMDEVFPDAELLPVEPSSALEPNRALATLPVRLAGATLPADLPHDSPLLWALGAAWAGLVLAGAAGGVTLHKVLALSERRAAFVSAVTHELRTPLTTFRLYADMLAGGIVPDENRRQEYLETLRREADRLAHLVDNVLQYARLERGRPGGRREAVTIGDLLDRTVPRLVDRARQAEMTVDVRADEDARRSTLLTDPQAVEQILFNLVDNATKYAARADDRRVTLRVEFEGGHRTFSVEDRGPGLSEAVRRRLFQPFCKPVDEAARSAPGVGLGLALSRRLAADLGGRLDWEPSPAGARFVLRLPPGSVLSPDP